MNTLPMDVLRIVWSMCEGCPLRFVCKRWANGCTHKQVYFSRLSTVSCYRWLTAPESHYKITPDTVYVIARHGHLKIFKWIFVEGKERFNRIPKQVLNETYYGEFSGQAAIGGQLHMLKWLKKSGYLISESTWAKAAAHGHIHVLEWLKKNKPILVGKVIDDACIQAAEKGQFLALKWLKENTTVALTITVTAAAATNGNLDTLKWLRDPEGGRAPWDIFATRNAAKHGHTDVLKWAIDNGCPYNNDTALEAVERGHLEALKVVESVFRPNDIWLANACSHGHLHIVEWLYTKGLVATAYEFARAASGGHLHVLAWLHARGCVWTHDAYAAAAQSGNLTILKWLRGVHDDEEKPYVEHTTRDGKVTRILPHGCHVVPWSHSTMVSSLYGRNIRCLKWLREQGCPWGALQIGSSKYWTVNTPELQKWLKEAGCPK